MPSGPAISSFSIYTMRHSNKLDEVYRSGGEGHFTENSRWVTGERLFLEAQKNGVQMPVIFSAAEKDSGLIYFGMLTKIELNDGQSDKPQTTYWFTGLTRLDDFRPLSSLTLLSTRKPLSDKFIRPYAICYTPAFLVGQDEADVFAVKSDAG